MREKTTLADRQEIVALKQAGESLQAVADKTGWAKETVRKVWRKYRRLGESGLQGGVAGRRASGPLSSFPPVVRYVALRLKCERPHAGPDVIRADMALRPSLQGLALPSSASLGLYFQQFGERLVVPRHHRQLPGQHSHLAGVRQVHECWLLDFDEKIHWPGVGWVNVMNLVDLASGVKLGSFVQDAGHPPHHHLMSFAQMRQALRQTFERWGLPDRIRTDHDRRLVAEGDYPFPMPFTLWLVALGIEHELIQRVTQNGGVERCHRTWEARLLDLALGQDWPAIQDYVNYEIWRMNAVLPSRGRHCHRLPPFLVYPEVRTPRRLYRLADELGLCQLDRVEHYLAQGHWLRRTSAKGQFHFNQDFFYLGKTYGRQTVVITFDLAQHQFVVSPAQGAASLLHFRPTWLSLAAITGLVDREV